MEYLPLKAVAEANGHSLDAFYFDEAILKYGRKGAQKRFWEYILREKPDVSIIGFNEYDVGMENFRKMLHEDSDIEKKKAIWLSILIAFLYGLTDEFHQSFTPGREPRIRDVAFDTIGASLSMLLIWKKF